MKLLFFALLLSPFLKAQSYDASCGPERQRMAAVIEQSQAKPAISQLTAYLQFLDAAPEEPADCVHNEIREKIGEVEAKLIGIEVAHQSLEPWKVLYCDSIDPKNRHCEGPQMDDTPLIPETKALRPTLNIAQESVARLMIDPQYGGQVLYALGGSAGAMQDGQMPVPLSCHDHTIDLTKLKKYRDPVLILVVERKDSLHLRKLVWFLKNPPNS